jgi:small subunit ribosomal protein S2
MATIDKMTSDESATNISKRERLQLSRSRAKLEKNLGSIADMTRLPAALFIIDINKEHIAVAEAKRLNIPVFALVDTNANPNSVDFAIPANDDASKSIAKILDIIVVAINEGLEERKADKNAEKSAEEGGEESSEAVLSKKLLIGDEDEDGKKGKDKEAAGGAGAPGKKPRRHTNTGGKPVNKK